MAYNSFTAVREHLSVQLRRNWLSAYGTESPSVDLDDSLTDLDWLFISFQHTNISQCRINP